jgi:primosomal protein N'
MIETTVRCDSCGVVALLPNTSGKQMRANVVRNRLAMSCWWRDPTSKKDLCPQCYRAHLTAFGNLLRIPS